MSLTKPLLTPAVEVYEDVPGFARTSSIPGFTKARGTLTVPDKYAGLPGFGTMPSSGPVVYGEGLRVTTRGDGRSVLVNAAGQQLRVLGGNHRPKKVANPGFSLTNTKGFVAFGISTLAGWMTGAKFIPTAIESLLGAGTISGVVQLGIGIGTEVGGAIAAFEGNPVLAGVLGGIGGAQLSRGYSLVTAPGPGGAALDILANTRGVGKGATAASLRRNNELFQRFFKFFR